MFDNTEFNKALHRALVKHIPELTLEAVTDLNLQRDKEAFTTAYWISDEKIFFTLIDRVLCVPGGTDEPYEDESRNVLAYSQGYALWERDSKTKEFQMGYIGFRHLDVFLFGEDLVDLEEFKEMIDILKLHNISDTERTYFYEKYEKQAKDLKERGLI